MPIFALWGPRGRGGESERRREGVEVSENFNFSLRQLSPLPVSPSLLSPSHRRRYSLPVPRRFLEKMGGAEEPGFRKAGTHQLQGQRKSLARKAGRKGDCGSADQVCRRGKDVGQIHREWIGGLLPDPERRRGCGGRGNEVEALEYGVELTTHERAHFLSPAVI